MPYFPKVKEAREALKAKALEIYEMQVRIIDMALAAQEFEVAAKANQFLLEHMPTEDGIRLLEGSVDKTASDSGPKGPTIQIGIALGSQKVHELPPATTVIDVTPDE